MIVSHRNLVDGGVEAVRKWSDNAEGMQVVPAMLDVGHCQNMKLHS